MRDQHPRLASPPGGARDPEPAGPVALQPRSPRGDAGIGLPEEVVAGSGGTVLRDAAYLPRTRRRASARVLIVQEVLLAVGAYGGAMMMTLVQPDDFLPPEWLAGMPFDSWVLPGIGLLVANGIVPTIALLGEARRRPWTTLAHVTVGGVLVGWIALQLVVIGYVAPAFQIGYLALGVVILAVALPALTADRGARRA